MTTTFLAGWCVAVLSSTVALAQAGWGLVNIGGPSSRAGHALAFDSQRGRTVLFGGSGSGGLLGDTWEWNGSSWAQTAVSGPPARSNHAMAYDSVRGRTVLFGGAGPGVLYGDTWEWNGFAWTQVATAGAAPMYEHAMAYDSQRGRTVMFGGPPGAGRTWEWDGAVWALVATTGPTVYRYHAMAYDSLRGRTVLFGGHVAGTSYSGDTWEWDGTTWLRVAITGPAPRAQLAMAYDRDRGRTVLFGGYRYSADMDDTWEWDGILWTPMGNTPPPARRFHAMAFDSQRSRTVMFGGANGATRLGDTWEWSGGSPSAFATAAIYGNACGGPPVPLGLWPDPASRPVIGQTARATVANAPTPVVAVSLGLRSDFANTFQLSLAGIGMSGCEMLQSADLFGLAVASTPTTQSFALPLPNTIGLFNQHVYLQAYALAPGQNLLGVIASNGVDWRFGTL